MDEQDEKTAPSASKPSDITVKPQRQKSVIPAAEKAARAALLRSRLSADSPRASALGRGSFIRGGRIARSGRAAGAAAGLRARGPGSGIPATSAHALSAGPAAGRGARLAQKTSSAATPETAAQARVAQGQALRLTSARLAGRLRSNPLFNISAHLGLGAQASHQAVSSDKDSPQVAATSDRTSSALGASAGTDASNPDSVQPSSTVDEEAVEMTEEQMEAERRAALGNMPVFGGGASPSVQAQAQSMKPAPLQSQQAASGADKPLSGFAFGQPSPSAAAAAAGTGAAGPDLAGSQQSAWPSLLRTQLAGASTGAPASQQPSSAFGRLSTCGGQIDRLPKPQQAPEGSAAPANRAADAKVRRSQRFGSNLGMSAETMFTSTSPSSGTQDDMAAMDDDGVGVAKGAILGTCEDMCPHAEIVKRCNIEDVPLFERTDPRVATTNTELAVKKFSRNIEQKPENFRTMAALQRTMAHLRGIMDRRDIALVNIHKYLWDRFRGVRQDLFVQGFEGPEAITMYEEHTRFMIMAEHELSEETTAAADQEAFNSHLNLEQINKALISLNAMYDKQRTLGQAMPCEAEFRAYHLLTLIGTHGRYRYDATEYQGALAGLSQEILGSGECQQVVSMQQALESGNWSAFLKLATSAPYLQGCLAHMYYQGVRARALNVIVAAARSTDASPVCYPAEDLQHMLYLNSPEDVLELCEMADLAMDDAMGTAGASAMVSIPKTLRATADCIPRRRSHAISAKAGVLRSTMAQGLQGLTAEELHARQTRQQQLQQHLAQQEAQRLQEQNVLQARMQQEQQQRAKEAAYQQAAELEARRRAAELEAARQVLAAKEAELQRQKVEREQVLVQQQRERDARARQEAVARAEQQRRAEEERARQAAAEQRRQQQLRLEQERRAAELKARLEAEEARRREEMKRQAEAAAKRREQERLRRMEEERQHRAAELRRCQEEGLKAVAKRRCLRLARQAVVQWKETVRQTRERQARERRTLQALADVHIGISPSPFKVQWPADEPQNKACSRSAQRMPPTDVPKLDMKAVVGPTLACQSHMAAEVHWKLMLLHYGGTEHVDAVLRLREALSSSQEQAHGHVLGMERFAVPHAGPAGERLISTAICDAGPSAHSAEAARTAMQGASAVLLLITDRDDPAAADSRLATMYAECQQKVPLLVLASRVPGDAVGTFVQRLLSSQTSWAQHVGDHKVVQLPESDSPAFSERLAAGLQWLAAQAPQPPDLQRVPLREMVLSWLQMAWETLDESTVSLPETIAACNEALHRAAECIREAARLPAAAWGWPPPETSSDSQSIPADWHHPEHQQRLKDALDRLRLPDFIAQGSGAEGQDRSKGVAGRKDPMQWAVGGPNAELDPCSAVLSAFLQRLHTLDAPEMLSAVIQRSSWPPRGRLGGSETLWQLALTPSLGSSCGGIARKRKGSSGLAERPPPLRKSKAEGTTASYASSPATPSSPGLLVSADSGWTQQDIFRDLPQDTSTSAVRAMSGTVLRLRRVRKELDAQAQANDRLADRLTGLGPGASPFLKQAAEQSPLEHIRTLAARMEREVMVGTEAEASMQLSPTQPVRVT